MCDGVKDYGEDLSPKEKEEANEVVNKVFRVFGFIPYEDAVIVTTMEETHKGSYHVQSDDRVGTVNTGINADNVVGFDYIGDNTIGTGFNEFGVMEGNGLE